ncbi:hypothetical protein AB0F91_19405 [Amycolatopsis sp. NPDC023774]|uniref:hypothetical protein n=1 Tax=Amycolatopsis sp. NPDC023774 TaxID=3155015 RepID=UPI0033FF04AE
MERYAEPFAALFSAEWPQRFLDLAWWRLSDASGHDSVTGCGVDDTATRVFARISETGHLGQAVRERVVGPLDRSVARDSPRVLNPTPAARRDLVTLDVETPCDEVSLELPDGTRLPAQVEARSGLAARGSDFLSAASAAHRAVAAAGPTTAEGRVRAHHLMG